MNLATWAALLLSAVLIAMYVGACIGRRPIRNPMDILVLGLGVVILFALRPLFGGDVFPWGPGLTAIVYVGVTLFVLLGFVRYVTFSMRLPRLSVLFDLAAILNSGVAASFSASMFYKDFMRAGEICSGAVRASDCTEQWTYIWSHAAFTMVFVGIAAWAAIRIQKSARMANRN